MLSSKPIFVQTCLIFALNKIFRVENEHYINQTFFGWNKFQNLKEIGGWQ